MKHILTFDSGMRKSNLYDRITLVSRTTNTTQAEFSKSVNCTQTSRSPEMLGTTTSPVFPPPQSLFRLQYSQTTHPFPSQGQKPLAHIYAQKSTFLSFWTHFQQAHSQFLLPYKKLKSLQQEYQRSDKQSEGRLRSVPADACSHLHGSEFYSPSNV